MPRPRSGDILKLEIRLTPYDSEPLTTGELTEVSTFFNKLILFEEGNDEKKLHYHGYVESVFSASKVREKLRSICHCHDQGVNGNVLFFTRKPHDHSWGYISKCGKCIWRHGETQTTIDEWITKSAEYRKSKSRDKKRRQRTREDELRSVVDQVEKDLHNDSSIRYVEAIISRILQICEHHDIRFPTRPQMDSFVLRLLYPYNDGKVRSYYEKSFCGF